MTAELTSTLRDETDLRWCWLEAEQDACLVVSERMELVYINSAGRELVPDGRFGKRCFEVLPVVDETCVFHCSKGRDVNESREVVYCEEIVRTPDGRRATLGVGLIPLGPGADDRARGVFLMRTKKGEDQSAFRAQLLRDAEGMRRRIAAQRTISERHSTIVPKVGPFGIL